MPRNSWFIIENIIRFSSTWCTPKLASDVATTTPPFAVIERACSMRSSAKEFTVMITTSQFLPIVSSGRIVNAASNAVAQPWVAPAPSARSTFVGSVSIAMTARAPACSAPRIAPEPTPPQPITATVSPARTPPRFTAEPNPVERPHEINAAARRSHHGSRRISDASCTTMYSLNAPTWHIRLSGWSPNRWRHVPSEIIGPARIVEPRSQMYDRPDTQYSQVPQDGVNETATWSPGAKAVTPSPTDSTTPEPSWPPIAGNIESRPESISRTTGSWVMPPLRRLSSE